VVGYFEHKFQGEGGSSTNNFWHQKTPGLSRGVVCVILRLVILVHYRCVTHRHTMMANTRTLLASRG